MGDVDAYNKVNHGKYSVCVEGMYGMAMYTKAENPATKEVEDAAYSLPESLVKSENPSLTGEELDKKRVFKYFTTLRSFVKECSERGISVADRDGATGTANYKWIQSCARYFSKSYCLLVCQWTVVSAATGGEPLSNTDIITTGWNFAVTDTTMKNLLYKRNA